jgi:hypothetical protein
LSPDELLRGTGAGVAILFDAGASQRSASSGFRRVAAIQTGDLEVSDHRLIGARFAA